MKNDELIGLARLLRMTIEGHDMGSLGMQLIARAGENPADACALMDLATILQLKGERELGLKIQRQALSIRQIYAVAGATPEEAEIRLLLVMGEGDLMANSPVECLMEHKNVALNIVYVTDKLDMPDNLPEHDVLFVAIAESEKNNPVLRKVSEKIASWHVPVLNDPLRIAALSRDNCARLLKDIPGVEMPQTLRLDRREIESLTMESIRERLGGGDLLIRPVDSHAGIELEKIDDAAGISRYLASSNAGEFYVSSFVDYRKADGQFRKCRIVLIAGRPYICHMAISSHWMIHYANAGMNESAEKREEEARFMEGFDRDFAARHAAAFKAINERIGLDYLGMDCAETADGRLLIFEADSCMIVHALDPVDVYGYKQKPIQRLFDAFHEMLLDAGA